MSVFDSQAFVNTELKGAIDTKIIPVPQGEYKAQISKEPKFREITNKHGDLQVIMDVSWEIDDDSVKKRTEMEHPTARQSVFLDVIRNKEGTAVAIDTSKGKSRQLGLLREALNQNIDGRNWSPAMLVGQVAKVKVEHSPNDQDPESPYANVTRVTKAA